MKKTFVILMAAGMMLLAGCDKADLAPQSKGQEITLSAVLPTQATKTSLDATDNTKVTWTEGDAIMVFAYNSGGYVSQKFVLTEGAGSVNGKFTGTITGTPEYVLYPYNSGDGAVSMDSTLGRPVIKSWNHTSQTPNPGSIDPESAIMIGSVSKGGLITLHHGVGYLKLTAPSLNTLYSISVESDGAALAGSVYYDTKDFTLIDRFGTNNTKLSGTFTPGATYYLAVRPFTSEGLTVRYTYIDDESKVTYLAKSSTAEISVAAGEVKTINVDMSGVSPTHPDS